MDFLWHRHQMLHQLMQFLLQLKSCYQVTILLCACLHRTWLLSSHLQEFHSQPGLLETWVPHLLPCRGFDPGDISELIKSANIRAGVKLTHTKLAVLRLDFIVGCSVGQLKGCIIIDLDIWLHHREEDARMECEKY